MVDDLATFKNDIQTIVCDVLNLDKTYLYLNPDKILKDNHIKEIDAKISRLLAGEPLAYILGYKYFWNQKLYVTKDTLIPRADTEVLVSTVLDNIVDKNADVKILDLGTGTGAIALALAAELANSQVVAVDLHQETLKIASKNAQANNIANVKFIQSSWYTSLDDGKFDIIVSNPPYIDLADTNIDQSVKDYEPAEALFAKNNGLADIKIIISQAKNFLKQGGCIYIEHGFTQANAVAALFSQYNFTGIKKIKDLNNNDRCTKARLNYLW
ncbi:MULTISPECIES: peptide chain release factor N(5)-glutamine methyltransferase [Francisella]|uniref:Release factor glutamine methyltransferase n=1 Tax=Francisella opportunistica TaxID=2016517 RepID=A0A345JTT5_9GAMM|nr:MULTISPECIES: peptide chain release factor N(5)-glutamine methyltransferase [Francisella]APC92244.1 Methylase [Francisella sp. MA067296]AXH30731.1 peptide chain release factor N(5)-glutamine methyltransferase [Francisella opportunistica]AXH32377.1 protein-(glutamine-N5) methyltransferase, release factor-specific [Francisella opportunistica]AXH34024.1 protein-(glutamine-N5) methyltransferase, release factor-specific [Francisella opportunistica]